MKLLNYNSRQNNIMLPPTSTYYFLLMSFVILSDLKSKIFPLTPLDFLAFLLQLIFTLTIKKQSKQVF